MGRTPKEGKVNRQGLLFATGVLAFLLLAGSAMAQPACLGAKTAQHYLIYSHGMDTESPSPQEQQNRRTLSELAQAMNLRIALPRAKGACPTQPHLKCWSWEFNKEAVQDVLTTAITEATECFPRNAAFSVVGFSNGAFLLNTAFQNCMQTGASFSISFSASGSTATPTDTDLSRCGKLALIVGNQDHANRDRARAFATTLTKQKADVVYREFIGGHTLDYDALKAQLEEFRPPLSALAVPGPDRSPARPR